MSLALLINPAAKRGKGGRFVKSSSRNKRRRKTSSHAAGISKRKRRRARRAPVVMHMAGRRYRRNPSRRAGRFSITDTMIPIAIGAGGALATDLAMGYLPLPDTMKTGMMRPFVKGGVAIGLGLLAGMLIDKSTGAKVMAGALMVVVYSEAKALLQTSMPALPLSGVDEYPMLEYAGGAMGVDEFGMPTDTSMAGLIDTDSMAGLIDTDGMGAVLESSELDGYPDFSSPEF